MAWIYSLSVECGIEKEAADKLSRHFEGIPIRYSDGNIEKCSAWIFRNPNGSFEVLLNTPRISRSGVKSIQEAQEMSELGAALYNRLKSAPPYRFALAGVEVDGAVDYEVIDQDMITQECYNGMVISEELWMRLGSPAAFIPFSMGYFWRPYQGEKYRPQM